MAPCDNKKPKKILFINFVISRHQLQFDYYIVRDVLKNFPQNFFFLAGGLWRMTVWSLINHSSPLARPIVWHTANYRSLTHDQRRRERSCDWLSQASRVIPTRLDPESPRPSHVNSTIVVPRGSSLISTHAKSGVTLSGDQCILFIYVM